MVQCEKNEVSTSLHEVCYQFLITSANYLNVEVSDKMIKDIVKDKAA